MVKLRSREELIQGTLELAKQHAIDFIELDFSDIHGNPKSVTIPFEQLKTSFEKGTWFDGSSIEGFTRIQESDMYLLPDPQTFTILPETNPNWRSASVICDVYTANGTPFEGDPRQVLKRVLQEAEELGYTYNVGPELEFFLFTKEEGRIKPVPHDVGGYFDSSAHDKATETRKKIMKHLYCYKIESEMAHHEVAPGQHEIDFHYGGALRTADKVMCFKRLVKNVAAQEGIYATFMPKPFYKKCGSGMHTHFSFAKDGKNIFYDPSGHLRLSPVAEGFIAGLLKHAKAITAIIAPTVNSYKRLVPGYEAPVYICWGHKNRSVLIRVPAVSPGREESTRAELRCPDPSCNPYLAFAAMLKAGLDGIKNNLELEKPVEGSMYEEVKGKPTLPESLGDAVREMKKSELLKKLFGQELFDKYVSAKQQEWDDFRRAVTDWELRSYLHRI